MQPTSFDQPPFHIAICVERRHFNRLGDEGEGAKDMRELGFGQAVEMSHEAIELGTEAGVFSGLQRLVFLETDLLGEVFEFGACAG
ncbi:MAG: hypothetical protein ACYCWC_10585 [Rhodocyclaceae bacterium]